MHDGDNSGWRVPMTRDGKDLGDVGFDGGQAKSFDRNFEVFIDLCLENHRLGPDFITDWKEMFQEYRIVRRWVNSRSVFTWDDVCQFQQETDSFMQRYIALNGIAGMTNYFHMIHAGHFAYFLDKYHNLYILSQQGWENVNSLLKRSFHRCTQRGGRGNGVSKLLPVFYRLHRAMLWRTGVLDRFFKHLGFDDTVPFEYGKIFKLPQFDVASMIDDIKEFGKKILNFAHPEDLMELDNEIDFDYVEELEWSSVPI